MNDPAQGRASAKTSRATVPRATYRLQLHKHFPFAAARERVPYFARLGISHLYLSPITTARAGSLHGYDQIDPTTINPELGGEEGLRALVAELRAYGMGLIIDIVPNHMAVGRDDNLWWLDVLEWGRDSRYAHFFDIDWDVPDPALHGRVLAPFLGKPYGEALDDGELQLCFDSTLGELHVRYYEHRFPIAPQDYAPLLRAHGEVLAAFAPGFRAAASERQPRTRRYAGFGDAQLKLAQAAVADTAVAQALEAMLQRYRTNEAEGRARLHALLERQHYRLAWWRAGPDEINWRRFFDVIELAGLRMQEPAVFEAVHATPLRLYAEGLIDGLRIDHVDGLADPRSYCRKLRARLAALEAQRPQALPRGPAWLVIEKILAPDEKLAADWRTDGTTGYSFMNEVGALLHDARGEASLRALWQQHSGSGADFDTEQRAARRRIPQELLTADFNACAHALHACARHDPHTRDWSLAAVRRVLAEVLVHFPIYRTYVDARGRSAADAEVLKGVFERAAETVRPADRPLLALFDRWLGGEAPQSLHGAAVRRDRLRAIARFQQLSSPVAAKSVEDTAFYRHGQLLSRNEVGADPVQFAIGLDEFHARCADRLQRYPHALLATATHDHKRGEDMRARLAVLSECADEWAQTMSRWQALHAPLRAHGPDAIDAMMLYQTLLGAWPLELRPDDEAGLEVFRQRLADWQRKAIREAKRRTAWTEPNAEYEAACEADLARLLDPKHSAEFLHELWRFVHRIAPAGAVKGLAQTLLKLTTPGVPDFYQGTEFWDLSLVDPDNRRPVDYTLRMQALQSVEDEDALLTRWLDGLLKQRLIARVLALRARLPQLFARGDYVPLAVHAPGDGAVHAAARLDDTAALIVIAPVDTAPLLGHNGVCWPEDTWRDAQLHLPPALHGEGWRMLLGDDDTPRALAPQLALDDVLQDWPVAVLVRVA